MLETIKRLYQEGKLTDVGLDNAVLKGWITADEAKQIQSMPDNQIIQDQEWVGAQ